VLILVFALLCLLGVGRASAATHVVINEFESDPPGTDNGSSEWVELFNPTNQALDLSGWTLTPTNGVTPTVTIRSASIAPLGYYVVNRTKESGEPGYWLNNDWEIIVLKDNHGNVIDNTTFKRADQANDDRTWQRFPNGQDTGSYGDWSFHAATKGFSNGGEQVPTPSGPGAGFGFALIGIGAGVGAAAGGIAIAATGGMRSEVFAYGGYYYCRRHRIPVWLVGGGLWCPLENRYLRPPK
jgi:hypothetical protein